MINELYIKNGKLSHSFDSLINLYTVNIDNNITKLDFDIVCNKDCKYNILNNNYLLEGDNKVVIEVTCKDKKSNYTFLVNRKESSAVFKDTTIINREPLYNSREISIGTITILFIIILLIDLFLFKLLFKKKKTKN